MEAAARVVGEMPDAVDRLTWTSAENQYRLSSDVQGGIGGQNPDLTSTTAVDVCI